MPLVEGSTYSFFQFVRKNFLFSTVLIVPASNVGNTEGPFLLNGVGGVARFWCCASVAADGATELSTLIHYSSIVMYSSCHIVNETIVKTNEDFNKLRKLNFHRLVHSMGQNSLCSTLVLPWF